MEHSFAGKDLRKKDLSWQDLRYEDFDKIDLTGAYLFGAYVDFASFKGANLTNTTFDLVTGIKTANFKGAIGAIAFPEVGSRSDTLLVIKHGKGLRFSTGCFRGSEKEFRAAVWERHGRKPYGKQYRECIKKAKEALK